MFGRRGKRGLADSDLPLVARVVPGWSDLTEDERNIVVTDTDRLLGKFRWEAARDFELTDTMMVHISAQAALPILGLDPSAYVKVGTVVVRPTTVRRTRVSDGPVPGVVEESSMYLAGEAEEGDGPVVLAWDSVVSDTHHPNRGHNVVIHEFAHKIDLLDNVFDGTPGIIDPARRQSWIEVCTEVYERLRAGEEPVGLREYAATNPAEFFAVSTETFFTVPLALVESEPDLYALLADFYGQDPAARRAS